MALTLLKITQITGEHEGKLNLVIFTAVIKNKQSWYLGISVLKEERTPRPKGMKDDNCAECHEVWGYPSRTASRAVEQGVQRERRERCHKLGVLRILANGLGTGMGKLQIDVDRGDEIMASA